jgi:hypothetical protein
MVQAPTTECDLKIWTLIRDALYYLIGRSVLRYILSRSSNWDLYHMTTFLFSALNFMFAFSFTVLIHQGVVLKEENTLKSYGIKPGVTIHVLRKRESRKYHDAVRCNE